jgi:hypothetical protein
MTQLLVAHMKLTIHKLIQKFDPCVNRRCWLQKADCYLFYIFFYFALRSSRFLRSFAAYNLSVKLSSMWLHIPDDRNLIIDCHGNFRYHITIIAPLSLVLLSLTAIIVQDNV